MPSKSHSISKRRVAFQGEIGAYSEQAAFAFFGPEIELVPQPTFRALFRSVADSHADSAVVPIENSLAGSVHENYDLLLQYRLPIVGEIILRIVHHLLVLPGVKKEEVRRVLSHPQALEQCRAYLEKWEGVIVEPAYDTAASAKRLMAEDLRDAAAIASQQAAAEYGLEIIESGIESNHENHTRFLILEREEKPPAENAKTSIVFSFRDMAGALFKCLAVFALRDINLLKIESRPLHGQPFRYYFYLDFEGSLADEAARNAIQNLREITTFLEVLGSYPAGRFV